jgi:hypothetical protein
VDEIALFRDLMQTRAAAVATARPVSAHAALLAHIEASEGRPRRSRVASRRRPLVAVLSGAAVLAVGIGLVQIDGGHEGLNSAAAAVLQRAAAVAASQPSEAPPRADQFVYSRSTEAHQASFDGEFSVLVPAELEVWISPMGNGIAREKSGPPQFLSAAERQRWIAAGSPKIGEGGVSSEHFAKHGGRFHYVDTAGLPTEPVALRRVIEAHEVPGIPAYVGGEEGVFLTVAELLRRTYSTPALRAAAYRVVAGLAGVQLLGSTKDSIGRSGIGVAFTSRGIRNDLIFDPKTSVLLGERTVVVDPQLSALDVGAGTVSGYTTYLESEVVDSAPKH